MTLKISAEELSSNVDGVGLATADALATQFETYEALRDASDEELTKNNYIQRRTDLVPVLRQHAARVVAQARLKEGELLREADQEAIKPVRSDEDTHVLISIIAGVDTERPLCVVRKRVKKHDGICLLSGIDFIDKLGWDKTWDECTPDERVFLRKLVADHQRAHHGPGTEVALTTSQIQAMKQAESLQVPGSKKTAK